MFRIDPKGARRRAAVVLALCVWPGILRAADPGATGATVPSDPVFTALRLDGSTLSGRVRQIGPGNQLVLVPEKGPEQAIALADLVKLTRDGASISFSSEASLILFPQGERLARAVVTAATDTTLEVQQFALGNLSIPLDCVLGIVLNQPPDPSARDALTNLVRHGTRTSEVVWLANHDRLTGGFLGLDELKVKLQTANGTLTLDRSGVTALGFDPALVAAPRPEATVLELTFVDGSRLGVTGARVDQGQLAATTRFGSPIRVATGELSSIHVLSASVAYLSDREATKAQYISYVGPTRDYRRDESVEGHPLRLAGQVYDRGLGTQSRTFLAYKLDPGDRRLQALVGLDDRAGTLGSVVFRVLVDGRERFVSPPMSARDKARTIDLDVSGAKLLVLVTEFGERGEVRDFADWVEARLIRKDPLGAAH